MPLERPPKQADSESPGAYSWWGIIGPSPGATSGGVIVTPHRRDRALDAPITVGPLHLRPGHRRLVEYQRTDPRALHGTVRHESWPIIVERISGGLSPRDDPRPTERAATLREGARELHRLVCLVSIGWGEPWGVRTAPQPVGPLPAVVPDSWPPPPDWHSGDAGLLDEQPTELPDWIAAAWDALDADPVLDRAFGAWHQGVLMSPAFPSYALVAFFSSVETAASSRVVAAAIAANASDDQAPAKAGSAQTVWTALSLVASSDDMQRLRHDYEAYRKRSHTAHEAQLHGIETAPGSLFLFQLEPASDGGPPVISIDDSDAPQMFELQLLAEVRGCVTRLLLGALTGTYAFRTP